MSPIDSPTVNETFAATVKRINARLRDLHLTPPVYRSGGRSQGIHRGGERDTIAVDDPTDTHTLVGYVNELFDIDLDPVDYGAKPLKPLEPPSWHPVKVGDFTPGSDDWHAARASGLGGSEISMAAGISPFESRFSLWHRKAGLIGPAEVTPVMEWGTRLEPAIARKFRDEHPEYLAVMPVGTWTRSDRPWQIANPDAACLVAGKKVAALVEAKTSRYGDGYGEPGTDEVPVHVRAQCLWYMDVLDVPVCHVAVLIGGSDYREYEIVYDPAEAAQLVAIGRTFLDTLANGERPDIDGHTATYETVRAIHPDIDREEDHQLDGWLARDYIAARIALSAAEERERHTKSQVADAMGQARRARWDDKTIASRQARGDGIPYLVAGRNLDQLDIGDTA